MTYPANPPDITSGGKCEDVWEGPIHADKTGLVYDVKLVSSSSKSGYCDKNKEYDHLSGVINVAENSGSHKEDRGLHFGNNGPPWQDLWVSSGVNMTDTSQ